MEQLIKEAYDLVVERNEEMGWDMDDVYGEVCEEVMILCENEDLEYDEDLVYDWFAANVG